MLKTQGLYKEAINKISQQESRYEREYNQLQNESNDQIKKLNDEISQLKVLLDSNIGL